MQDKNCTLGQHLPQQDELGDGRGVIRSDWDFILLHLKLHLKHFHGCLWSWLKRLQPFTVHVSSHDQRVFALFTVCRDDPDPQRHWSPSVCPVGTPAAGTVCLHHTRAFHADLCVFLATKQSKSFVNFLVFCCFRINIYKPYECFQGSWKTLNLVKSTIILSCGVHAVLKQKLNLL